MLDLRRRDFIALLGGTAAAWPLMARAQQPRMPAVGILGSVSPGPYARFIEAIKQGLREAGYVEGRNVAIEYRWADGQYDRLPQLATELVDRGVALIILVGGGSTTAAATGSKGVSGGRVTCHAPTPCAPHRSSNTSFRGHLRVVPSRVNHSQFAVFRRRNRDIYGVGLEKRGDFSRRSGRARGRTGRGHWFPSEEGGSKSANM
jgi:hypothetical protein